MWITTLNLTQLPSILDPSLASTSAIAFASWFTCTNETLGSSTNILLSLLQWNLSSHGQIFKLRIHDKAFFKSDSIRISPCCSHTLFLDSSRANTISSKHNANFDSVYADVLFFLFFLALGAKTTKDAKLKGPFCSFLLLGGQNRNFVKVRGLKLQLSLKSTKKLLIVRKTQVYIPEKY